MTETKSGYETSYSYGEQVIIISGFYKGYDGKIVDVKQEKEEYIYSLEVNLLKTYNSKPKIIEVKENQLKKQYIILGFKIK